MNYTDQKPKMKRYELLRLRNIYTIWELNKGGSQQEKPKRTIDKVLPESDETTPVKRKRLLQSMELKTPSPLKKNFHIDEKEMKSLSDFTFVPRGKWEGLNFFRK